ncbi:MAG: radical SAM protein [Bryobacteraceae bacterium]|nr:radical SAM protein [Bryobacterales bacterium]MEB2362380.1 radical SAM protein [Bryobacterales bacterium]NUN00311.1 radical SAM protein [Bryobacteraceae bacterium]
MSTQTFAPVKSNSFAILQPEKTLAGSPIQPIRKGLPKTTQSLCPECSQVIDATIFEENGRVLMEKTCPQHGDFRDTVYSDARLYLKMEEWSFGDNRGVSNPAVPNATKCPDECGLCSMHTSHTGLANVDLTNRCNLTCPVCFANANASGYLYEPPVDQIRTMLLALRAERPVSGRIVQFSGGEPTIHPEFIRIVAMAREMGFSHIQAATNGIKFSNLEFAQRAKEAGLHTLYLQFDGVCDEIYQRTRGESLIEKKLQCIENARKAGLKICFVPTIVKGLNDHQIGDVIRLALDNIDCVSAISFQPVAFTGRISRRELEQKRFTLPDLARAVHEQTGICDMYEDWFPLSCVTPFSKLLSALRGELTTHLSCHPHCSIGTYLFVDQNKKGTPVTRFIDIGGMLQDMDLLARKADKQRIKFFSKLSAWNSLRKHFHADRAPEGLTFEKFLQTLQGMMDKRYGRGKAEEANFSYKTLMVAGMHFMDHYNYDIERLKRCVIHYAAPNGLIYPFCAYNGGPTYRERIELAYSVAIEDQPQMKVLRTGRIDQRHPPLVTATLS